MFVVVVVVIVGMPGGRPLMVVVDSLELRDQSIIGRSATRSDTFHRIPTAAGKPITMPKRGVSCADAPAGRRRQAASAIKRVCRIGTRLHYDSPAMTYSRRSFMKWTAAVSAAVGSPAGATLFGDGPTGFRPDLLPPQKEVWQQQLWMAKLGPKYTGNTAHTTFVEFLASEFAKTGCE